MKMLLSGVVLAMGLAGLAHAAGDPSEGQAKSAVCAGCHGADGNSALPNFPKLAGQHESYLYKQLVDIKSGDRAVVEMTGILDNYSEEDMRNVAAYYAQQTSSIGQANPELVELGASLYKAGNAAKGIPSCTGCHSPSGLGNAPAGFPRLSGQHSDYIKKQLEMFRSGERMNDGEARMMRDIAANLSDQEIEALSSYISGLY